MGNAIWIGQISGKEAIAELRYRKEVVAGIEMRSLRIHSFFTNFKAYTVKIITYPL